jgi:two-component system nitrate/nitrite response regulator NarL
LGRTFECDPVLIVDDDAAFRALAQTLFSRAGYATVEAASGTEALAAVRAARPALVVLDVSLPDVNGYEVCRELRDEFDNELPIIFVSGERVDAVDRTVGLLVGGDDYVVKPFDADEFLARARRAIVRSRPERERLTTPLDFDLTNREIEVLGRLAEGQPPRDIASGLFISAKTVASHIQRILAKLGVHSRAQAVAVAYQSGMLNGTDGAEEGAAVARTQRRL